MSVTTSLSTSSFDHVRAMVHRESAIVLAPGKEYLVEARLAPLARARGLRDAQALVEAVRTAPDRETTQLIVEALTTNETSWLRDGDPFTGFVEVIVPSLVASRPAHEPLRIWSAACSSGQEPYTIAMLVKDALPGAAARVRISASDISRAMVERTRAGRFSQLEVNRGLPAPMMVRHLARSGSEWQVAPDLRRMVTAFECNLAAPLPRLAGPFDVVFLRNVLIYFDVATKRSILTRVRALMRPDGWLVLGAAESTLGVDDAWERVVVGRTSFHRPTRQQRGA